jgi:hypothetical protein
VRPLFAFPPLEHDGNLTVGANWPAAGHEVADARPLFYQTTLLQFRQAAADGGVMQVQHAGERRFGRHALAGCKSPVADPFQNAVTGDVRFKVCVLGH